MDGHLTLLASNRTDAGLGLTPAWDCPDQLRGVLAVVDYFIMLFVLAPSKSNMLEIGS